MTRKPQTPPAKITAQNRKDIFHAVLSKALQGDVEAARFLADIEQKLRPTEDRPSKRVTK